jgi:methyl-accepting chemotaxis protein
MAWPFSKSDAGERAVLTAVDKSQAMIEFSMAGEVLAANANFLAAMGYSLAEIKGKHHSLFVDPQYRASSEYRSFWEKLQAGEFMAGQFRRIAKDGTTIWLQATYTPILDGAGKPVKVIKFASDITAQKRHDADLEGRMAAVDKVQAVIEFDLTGKILSANENFLQAMGYRMEEIKGQHHSMFVDPAERGSATYLDFWDKLRRGEFVADRFKRIGKDQREVWIQARYSPVLDVDGKPCKVVKFATDITDQVRATRVLGEVVGTVVDAVRNKDLTARVDTRGIPADLVSLGQGLNDLLDALTGVIEAVQDSSDDTMAATTEIQTGSQDLAGRTEQQAASLEETAATTEQLAASVKTGAQSARQAVAHAEEARSVAEEGGRIVATAVESMTRIEQASTKISEITDVIEEIAFQTNLLALNAAVEAARAGDAGKGFAVVAAEVRTLAQRSSVAAKDIGGLISSSTEQVTDGVRRVKEAGATLVRIVDASGKVAETVNEISSATGEQANGIDEMSQVIAHLDEMTQQNAALAEQSSASAVSLAQRVGALKDLVADYRTGKQRTRGAARPETEPQRLRNLAQQAFGSAHAAPRPEAGKAPRQADKADKADKLAPKALAPAAKASPPVRPKMAATGRGGWNEF